MIPMTRNPSPKRQSAEDKAPPEDAKLDRPGWYRAVVKDTTLLVHVHDDGNLLYPRYWDGYRGYSYEDLTFHAPVKKSWWAIGDMLPEPGSRGCMQIFAVAASKELALRKRDQFFPGKVISRLPPSETDRVLGEHDQFCLYTELPALIAVKVDDGRATPGNKRVKDAESLLQL